VTKYWNELCLRFLIRLKAVVTWLLCICSLNLGFSILSINNEICISLEIKILFLPADKALHVKIIEDE
jgi:hypothetical protein